MKTVTYAHNFVRRELSHKRTGAFISVSEGRRLLTVSIVYNSAISEQSQDELETESLQAEDEV